MEDSRDLHAFTALKSLMQSDPEYAWGWHCNLAMPIMDAIGCTHEEANEAGAHLMSFLWEVDVTKDERYSGGKSAAQSTHEWLSQVEGR